jgi:endonuclease YncB( thermonuclease family)
MKTMSDYFSGRVSRVIDGDTFDMAVERVGTDNKYNYNSVERIRIAGYNSSELGTAAGNMAKQSLYLKIGGKRVGVTVDSRDVYGRIVGSIQVL